MFTPPPSPLPRNSAKGKQPAAHGERDADQAAQPSPTTRSYFSGRHFFRVFALVGLILATLCTTYLVQGHYTRKNHVPGIIPWQNQHDSSSLSSSFGHELPLDKLYRRQRLSPSALIVSRTSTISTSSTASSRTTSTSSSRRPTSTTPVSNQPVPTIPSSPPILPTPFPQAFDGSGIPQNFTSTSCAAFFSNMTATAPFRTCRPFSLLLGTSSAFINAQTNLTLLNSIIWGTCNTPTPYEQCKSNMAWFAGALQTACAQELKGRSAIALNTLIGLQTFPLMHTAGCLSDPSSRTYCYLTAALAANPFDIFLFSLPLGTHLPKTNSSSSKTFNITPSCSACSKSLMGLFADALRPSKSSSSSSSTLDTSASDLSGLRSTYNEALEVCQSGCGPEFVLVGVGVGVSSATKAAARIGVVGLGTWPWPSSWIWTWFFGAWTTTTALLVWI